MSDAKLANPFKNVLQITGAVDESLADLYLQEKRHERNQRIHMHYPGPALFPVLAKIAGINITSKTFDGKVNYDIEVEDVENKEFAAIFKHWVDFYKESLLTSRPRTRIISDPFVSHRRYTLMDYQAVVGAIRLFDPILAEFKQKFKGGVYPDPILVYAEAGIEVRTVPRRGGRHGPVNIGLYGALTAGEQEGHLDETMRVFIGIRGMSTKRLYRFWSGRPGFRFLPAKTFLHELMHHVKAVRRIPEETDHDDDDLLEIARAELSDSYIPTLYERLIKLGKLFDSFVKSLSEPSLWRNLDREIAREERSIKNLLRRPTPFVKPQTRHNSDIGGTLKK